MKRYFKDEVLIAIGLAILVAMVINIMVDRNNIEVIEVKKTRRPDIVKMQKLLRADFDSYGKEIGLSGPLACMKYHQDKSLCELIYEGVK